MAYLCKHSIYTFIIVCSKRQLWYQGFIQGQAQEGRKQSSFHMLMFAELCLDLVFFFHQPLITRQVWVFTIVTNIPRLSLCMLRFKFCRQVWEGVQESLEYVMKNVDDMYIHLLYPSYNNSAFRLCSGRRVLHVPITSTLCKIPVGNDESCALCHQALAHMADFLCHVKWVCDCLSLFYSTSRLQIDYAHFKVYT